MLKPKSCKVLINTKMPNSRNANLGLKEFLSGNSCRPKNQTKSKET